MLAVRKRIPAPRRRASMRAGTNTAKVFPTPVGASRARTAASASLRNP
ncbi:hypothetical protein SY1_07300 [Fretibacterium fastidiosum]|uniref:Uncharacterized protein n=1 Tax=Fretibacterium fastidiosum TaxID=651822 RepID=A0AB94IW95_9BACT|nr:hypothetical protein SY1_07300 [Fretibacterium fastidiosum]